MLYINAVLQCLLTYLLNNQQDAWLIKYDQICSQSFSERECLDLHAFLMKTLVKFFLINNLHSCADESNLICLSSCRPTKFSLHVISKVLLFDRNYLGCRVFVCKLAMKYSLALMVCSISMPTFQYFICSISMLTFLFFLFRVFFPFPMDSYK